MNDKEQTLEQLETEYKELLGKLKGNQGRFVEEYLIDLNGSQAAIRAGYSKKTSSVIAAELLRKPSIRQCVSLAQEVRSRRTQTTQDWVLLELRSIYEDAKERKNSSAANRSLQLIGKHLGMFGEGKEEKHLHLHKDKYVNYPEVPATVKEWIAQMKEIGYDAGIAPVKGGEGENSQSE